MLKYFTYKFYDGPLATREELVGEWTTGNCRRAVQYYIFHSKGIFLQPNEALCPDLYYETGTFVVPENELFSFDKLIEGDLIFAERIRNKEGGFVDRTRASFAGESEYITSLHSAIFLGQRGREIWHATAVQGSSCYWDLEKFLHFYKPIAAKRISKLH